eukprot:TRINITY_DN75380_c0_g1_i1.p1 TRINITY_DN75380_c0_g1~~TRINITY_DN75380_c0_g1_i1.p1  ORF type:complete len:564 (-),score=46.22 TRINITY_DN75380_c0_g1_i1:74-1642(-)
MVFYWKANGITFGAADKLASQELFELILYVLVSLPVTPLYSMNWYFSSTLASIGIIGIITIVLLCQTFFGRASLFWMVIQTYFRAFGHYAFAPPTSPLHGGFPYLNFTLLCSGLVAFRAKYQRGRCIIIFLSGVVTAAGSIGAMIARGSAGQACIYGVITLVFSYAFVLVVRKRRRLPSGLEGCKFITLSYVRSLDRRNTSIRRCQDIPAHAFGDVSQASYFIVVSHRWLDRHECDVNSFRVGTMLSRLEKYFSLRGLWEGSGLRDRWRRFCMSLTSGQDVLIFFDFASLPQDGIDANGDIVERSPDELKLFEKCLPNMSLMYSCFHVLICDEVLTDQRPYLESGWCFTEMCIAHLGDRLDMYSSDSEALAMLPSGGSASEKLQQLMKDLPSKKFYFDHDRQIAEHLISQFRLKAEICDAISAKQTGDLVQLLREVQERGFGDIMRQPVNSVQDTFLHLAVKCRFALGVDLLLDAGADPRQRNLRGDTATRFFMFPLFSLAASKCKRKRSVNNQPVQCGETE